MEWVTIRDLFLITGMVSLIFLFLMVQKKKKGFTKLFLLLLMAQAFFFFLFFYALNHSFFVLAGVSFFFGNGSGMFQGPLLYFFCISLVSIDQSVQRKFLIHLIPYFLKVIIYNLPTSLALIFEIKPWFAILGTNTALFVNLAENLFFLFYALLALKLLPKLTLLAKEEYSNLQNRDLEWLKYLILGITLLVLLDSTFSIYVLIKEPIGGFLTDIVVFSYVAIYLILGYKGVFQSKMLLPDFLLEKAFDSASKQIQEKENTISKKSNSFTSEPSFSNQEIEEFTESIDYQLEVEKIYLDEKLSLKDLAENVNLPEKKISQFINQQMNVNFYTLINQYRVEEVKRKLASGEFEHLSILGIALDSGFQSKSSFNRVFKQYTGKSPSEYKRKIGANI